MNVTIESPIRLHRLGDGLPDRVLSLGGLILQEPHDVPGGVLQEADITIGRIVDHRAGDLLELDVAKTCGPAARLQLRLEPPQAGVGVGHQHEAPTAQRGVEIGLRNLQ